MTETTSGLMAALERSQQVAEKIFSAARPGAVFAEPVRTGDYTLITASEIVAAGGFGFGGGSGGGPEEAAAGRGAAADTTPGAGSRQPTNGGGGAGGGGMSMARPVATIIVGPDGVKVRPVVDATKIAIAFATAWGAMALMMARMGRARRA
jgi:uncharacterized spore protein YtfJ